ELLPARWAIKNQRHGEGHDWSRVVHPEPHRALLFSASQVRSTESGLSPDELDVMESPSQAPARTSPGRRTLVIMAKAPRPGRVKTRLSETLPSAAVLALYRCLLDDTFALAKSLKQVEVAVMCPDQDRDELAQLAGDHVEVVTQKGEGLA